METVDRVVAVDRMMTTRVVVGQGKAVGLPKERPQVVKLVHPLERA